MFKASDLRCAHGDNTIFDGLSLTLSGPGASASSARTAPARRRCCACSRASPLLSAAASRAVRATGSATCRRSRQAPELTIDRLLGAALGEVWTLHAELERLEHRLHEPAALAAYGEAQERFGALDGWALHSQLDGARDALGIAHVPLDAPLGSLSGGEAARALLAGVLLARADRAAARRADQPPRPRRPRVAGGLPRRVPRRRAGGLPRPPVPRRHRVADVELERRRADRVRGRLHGVPRGEGAPARRGWRSRTRRRRSAASGWRPTSRHARLRAAHREHRQPGRGADSSSATRRRWRRRRSRASGGCERELDSEAHIDKPRRAARAEGRARGRRRRAARGGGCATSPPAGTASRCCTAST